MTTIPQTRNTIDQERDLDPCELSSIALLQDTQQHPRKRYRTIIPVESMPLEAGEINPRAANTILTTTMFVICMPSPTMTQNSFEQVGYPKTSSTTSFHPDTSSFSWVWAFLSNPSYLLRSLRTVHWMVMPFRLVNILTGKLSSIMLTW